MTPEVKSIIVVSSIVLATIILLVGLWKIVSKNYIRIAPNSAAVLYGRKNKSADGKTKGYRLITGGGVFKIPFFEQVQYMNLSNRVIPIKTQNAPNLNGVMTTVEGVANTKISSDKALLEIAVERFLGKPDKEIDQIIYQNLEGHLRSVVGKMTMEELIGNKQKLNSAVLEDSQEDFKKLGITVDSLNIQNISDEAQYIVNLGKKRAAEIKRDAEIGTAEADRDSVIKTTDAQRTGIENKNANLMKVAEADRNLGVKKAQMKAEVDTQNEIANQAGPLSNAQALKAVVVQRATTEAAGETANIEVQKQKALKEEQRYVAEVVVPAEAQRKAKVINADASKQAFVLEAEGKKLATIKIAEGDAEAIKIKKQGEAEGEAALIFKKGEAEGKAIYAKLSAEAKGTSEKAEAYAKLDATGKFLEILLALQTLGPNVVKAFAEVMAASTAHLSGIKDVKIIDFGGQKNGSTLGNIGTVPVEILTKMFEGLKGTVFDMSTLLNFLGIKAEDLLKVPEKKPDVSEKKPETPKPDKK
jgi:flotillin